MAEEKKDQTAKINQNEQEKVKNQTKQQGREEELKTKSPAELRRLLSNKNADYVFRLQKELEQQGNMSAEQAKEKVDSLLVEIISAQWRGQPANGLYLASPKIKANQIIHPHRKPKTLADFPFWQRGVDNALLWLAIFMGIYGLLGLFNTKHLSSQNGVLTIASTGILLGLFMAKYDDWIAPMTQGGKRSKIHWPRVIGISVLLIVGLIVWISLLSLPGIRVINPVLPGIVYIIIAVAAYGIRYWFRKRYHIVGSAFGSPRRR